MIDFKDLRYRLEYAGFRLIQAAIFALPLEAASRGSGMAWRLIAPHLYRQKRVLNNLALATLTGFVGTLGSAQLAGFGDDQRAGLLPPQRHLVPAPARQHGHGQELRPGRCRRDRIRRG